MGSMGWGMGFGGVFFLAFMVLFYVLLEAAKSKEEPKGEAMEALRLRCAKGELDEKAFKELLEALKGGRA
ncbi:MULTISPECIES: hypothetical protein [Thermus]|jgi:putative membrane protein|uniref:SHOCT domain-containing protein n=1 Tax=Thermus brockianus TaxID=56956 RepID=A0A1J0LUS3_THEBO|nr:hypothetical protein [Thermus brockianus]APD09395.1 hypothetical protein A0O31_01260 [Thermus brockianus]